MRWQRKRVLRLKTDYLLEREVELVLAALMPANALALRTALHTGLRIGDVLQLKPEQLKARFWITEQKTGKKRQVGLPAPLLAELRENAGEYWVFPGRTPEKHRSRQAVWKDMKRAARAFRLPVNAGPHSARKVYAVELMRKYGDIDRVRRALNHDSEITTLLYALADRQREAKQHSRKRS